MKMRSPLSRAGTLGVVVLAAALAALGATTAPANAALGLPARPRPRRRSLPGRTTPATRTHPTAGSRPARPAGRWPEARRSSPATRRSSCTARASATRSRCRQEAARPRRRCASASSRARCASSRPTRARPTSKLKVQVIYGGGVGGLLSLVTKTLGLSDFGYVTAGPAWQPSSSIGMLSGTLPLLTKSVQFRFLAGRR